MTEHLNHQQLTAELHVNDAPVRIYLAPGRLRPKLGFLGPHGTYTEEAAERMLFGNSKVEGEPLQTTNDEVVRQIDSGTYDIGVVAAENSTQGDVMETLRAIVHAKDVTILGETIIPIQHMLIGRLHEEVLQILSHPQALGQCRDFLSTQYPNARRIQTNSTADAADQIQQLPNAAAIASKRVAELKGLPILYKNIGDNPNNATRFLLIGRGETEPTGNDITRLLFEPQADHPGVLLDCLRVFAANNINLNKIDSYPTGDLDRHRFFVSLTGHMKDLQVQDALNHLQRTHEASVRLLGSYKKATIPEGAKEPSIINCE